MWSDVACHDYDRILKINSLAFRVKGNNINLHDNYEDELKLSRKKFEKNLEEKEKQANEFLSKNKQKNSSENSEKSFLPPELLAKFDSIRQSMLTNDDNKWYILVLFLKLYDEINI